MVIKKNDFLHLQKQPLTMSTKLAYLKSVLDGVLLPDLVNLINQFAPDIIIDDVSYIQKNVSDSMLREARSIHFYNTFRILNGMIFRKIEKMTGVPTINATSFALMFGDAKSFNGDLSGWDVSKVIDMSGMFVDARSFDCNLSRWGVSKIILASSKFNTTDAYIWRALGRAILWGAIGCVVLAIIGQLFFNQKII